MKEEQKLYQIEELKQETNLICFQILSLFLHILAFKQLYYHYSYAIFWKDTHFHSYDRVIPIQRLHLILHLNATHLNKEKKRDFLNILSNVSAIPFNCKFLKRIRIMFPSPFEVRKEKFRWARFHTAIVFKGTINLERQHFLGGRGKKIGQICRRKRGGTLRLYGSYWLC